MLRNATMDDLDFIYELVLDGSKYGYFNRKFHGLPEAAKGLRLELASILKKQIRPNGLRAYGIVYEHDSRPVGFVVMSAGEQNKGNELWMVAVHPDFRNKGHGRKMIQGVLEKFKGRNLFLYARCAPESERMYQLLLKNGFTRRIIDENSYRVIMYEL